MVLQRAIGLITVIVFIGLLNGIKCKRQDSGNGGYRIPRPKATVLYPSGFRVSIPDEQGIALFAFHGSINKNLRGNELGDFSADTRTKYNNNEWAFETTRYNLQPGDILNFWVYVQHNNFGYRLENQNYIYPNDFVTSISNTQTQNTGPNYEYSETQESSELNYDKNVSGNPIWDAVNTQQQQQPVNRPQETQYGIGNSNQDSYSQPSTRPTSRPTHDSNSNVYQQQRPTSRPSYESNSNIYQEPNRQSSTRPTSRPAIPYTTNPHNFEESHPQTTRATSRPVNSLYENTNVNGYENPYRQTTTSTTVRPRQTTRRSTQRTTSTREPNSWSTTTGRPLVYYPNQNSNSNRDQTSDQNYNLNQIPSTTGQNQDHYYNTNQGSNLNLNQNQNHNNQGHNQNNQGQNPNNQSHNYNSNHQSQIHNNNNIDDNNQVPNRNCRPSMTTMNGGRRVKCTGTLLFDEQFTGNVRSKWSPDIRMPLENEDAEFVLYHDYPSVWNVSNGNLHIYPKLLYTVPEIGYSEEDIRTGRYTINQNECTPLVDPIQECQRHAGLKRILPPLVTTKIRSKKSFSFKFGRVEIRAKLPKGDWLFPQLLLEPTQNTYRGVGELPYLNGQVRIAFIHGNEYLEKADGIPLDGKFLVSQTIVAPGDYFREISRKSIQIGHDHFGNDFHTYSIIWTNTSIKFIVDDLEYGSDTANFKKVKTLPNALYWESGSTMAPFDQEFHISLGVAAGGNADFPENSFSGPLRTPKPWENTSPKAELNFYLSAHEWHSTWNSHDSGLIVDYVKVYSV